MRIGNSPSVPSPRVPQGRGVPAGPTPKAPATPRDKSNIGGNFPPIDKDEMERLKREMKLMEQKEKALAPYRKMAQEALDKMMKGENVPENYKERVRRLINMEQDPKLVKTQARFLKMLADKGVKLNIVSREKMNQYYPKDKNGNPIVANGFYHPGIKAVYISADSLQRQTLFHELGHAFDDMIQRNGAKGNMRSDYDKNIQANYRNYVKRCRETGTFLWARDGNARLNHEEYFAEAMSAFLRGDGTFRAKDPAMYNYLKQLLANNLP